MDFANRSNEEQIARLACLAKAALAAWDMTSADIELLKYRENAVFRIESADKGRYVLRLHPYC